MRARFGWVGVAVAVAGLAIGAPRRLRAEVALRYWVVPRGAADPAGARRSIAEEVQRVFVEALQHRQDVSLDRPAWLTDDPVQMKAELARRGVRAYDANIQVDAVTEEVVPLAGGKRKLEVSVKLHLFGNTLPDRVLKIGGSGEAVSSVVLGDNADPDRAVRRLLRDLERAAVLEAIAATERKIALVAEQERRGARPVSPGTAAAR